MEYERSFYCRVEIDTNKETRRNEYTHSDVAAMAILSGMSDEERMDVFRNFCTHCGSDDPRCQCWSDE
jgi:hypothetical protein